MTVSVTHSQQLAITTSSSNPIMPLTMVQQSSSTVPVSAGPIQSTSISTYISPNSGCSDVTAPTNDSKTHQPHNLQHTSPNQQTSQSYSANRTNQHFSNNNNNNCNNNTTCASNTSSSSSTSTSASTTALRRLYFKSGRSAKTRQTPSVPKVVVMGSSSTSEATINTSTESASTLVTNITATTDTETTIDSLDLGESTSGQSDPLLSSSLDEQQQTSITSETDSLERDEINSIVAAAISCAQDPDTSSMMTNYEEIPLHPFKSPQTAPLVTSTRFQFDPPQSPKSVRTYEKNQTLFTFDDYNKDGSNSGKRMAGTGASETRRYYKNENDKENLEHEKCIGDHHDKKSRKTSRKERFSMSNKKINSAPPVSTSAQIGYDKSVNFDDNEHDKNATMFPFDREAIDYDRIQQECFTVEDETKFSYEPSPLNLDYATDYYECMRRDCLSPSEMFHQYTLLSQQEKNIYDRSVKRRSNFDEISSRFDQMSPVFYDHQFNTSFTPRSTPPPLPDLRVDYFAETVTNQTTTSSSSNSTSTSSSVAVAATGLHSQLQSRQDDTQMASCHKYTSSSSSNSSGGPINVTPNPMDAAVYTQPRATIVVQQASLSLDNTVETYLLKNEEDFISVEQGKESRKKKQREENMRQLLDVTNTFTSEEIRDFEMRYGSPHHNRSQSMKTPGSRASGRPNQLSLPQQRSRVASMPNTGVEEEYYRLRHFSITGKGVINRGDSLKSRRSRSNNSVASSNSSTEHLTAVPAPQPTTAHTGGNSVKTSATCSLASSRESSTSNPGQQSYRVLMLGASAVGKSSLVSQFMTSEYLHAYDTSIDDDTGEKSVSVLLSGEESELMFIDHPHNEMMPENCISTYDPHGYCVIYSASDKSSFVIAERILQTLWTSENIAQKAVILVGNKADLARSRVITPEEGKSMATAYDCKFIETSVGINHNVDELLVGILSQIRLKLENPEKSRDLFRKRSTRKSKRRACSPLGNAATACLSGNGGTNTSTPISNINFNDFSTPPGSAHSSPRKYRGSRTSASLKVKGLLGRVWARDSKSKSCENLHVL